MAGEQSKLERRVVAAAEAQLARSKFVSPVALVASLGWLPGRVVEQWQQGRVEHLESAAAVSPDKLALALEHFHHWARARHLEPTETPYVAATRDRRPLRFTAAGAEAVERAWRTHWLSPGLSQAGRDRLLRRQSQPPDLVVVWATGDWSCVDCGDTGEFLVVEDEQSRCLSCVDMDHLVFLPSGDATLSRRAKKASRLAAVVVRFARGRKRYERRGILVEEAALELAEEQCLADADVRERRRERDRERRAHADVAFQARFAEEIRRHFPGIPTDRAERIARHAGERGSRRVGRSAAGQALGERAVELAVIASVRHEDTDYDDLLMSGVPRQQARDRIAADIDRVLLAWRSPG
ncbi:DUF2293 domain-containing protein [Goodfellowiella coeruleoviolacea]|uniref:DUF2293 domain-containing protein n=1 Tax=Goodfellowiella coeruleoviolacea TaxID=334858 RepID=A0AAE3G8I8_9PSEU|nr:DUF2293 domain-containing protein [Goodfellowiella coeruleoviolacea]MCP2163637.1 hypothetical protein [Goodfellowiella coeruleoviolacea]